MLLVVRLFFPFLPSLLQELAQSGPSLHSLVLLYFQGFQLEEAFPFLVRYWMHYKFWALLYFELDCFFVFFLLLLLGQLLYSWILLFKFLLLRSFHGRDILVFLRRYRTSQFLLWTPGPISFGCGLDRSWLSLSLSLKFFHILWLFRLEIFWSLERSFDWTKEV